MAWFLAGVLLSVLNTLLVIAFVARLRPMRPSRLRRRVFSGYLVRYLIVALLLALAVQQSTRDGLAAAAGFWAARWLGVYLAAKGRLSWVWSS